MPNLVDLSERYHLLGVAPVDHEDNSDMDSAADQHVESQVVYTTNDIEEARSICRGGGWVQDGKYIAVSGYRDTMRVPAADEGSPAPLKRNVPHNVDQG